MSSNKLVFIRPLIKAEEYLPARLLTRHDFWMKNIHFVVVLIATIVFIASVFLMSFQDWVSTFFSLFIYGGVVWGGYLTALQLANLEVEYATVYSVQEALDQHKLEKQRKKLKNLENDLLPNNSNDPLPLTYQMFLKVLKEAEDHRFDTCRGVIAPYQEAIVNDLFDLRSIQTLSLRIGIMGTFLGLLYGLASFSGMFAEDAQIISSAGSLVDALRIAFGTSVAGLVVSVVIAFFIMIIRHKHKMLFRAMESSVIDMISAASNAINEDSFRASELRALRHVMEKHQERTHELAREIDNGLNKVAPWVKQQEGILQQGIDQLCKAGSKLDEYLADQTKIIQQSTEQQEKSLGVFEQLIGDVHNKSLVSSEEAAIKMAKQVNNFSDALKDLLLKIQKDHKTQLQGSIQSFVAATESLEQSLENQRIFQNEDTGKLMTELNQLCSSVQVDQSLLEDIKIAMEKLWGVLDSREERWVTTIEPIVKTSIEDQWAKFDKYLEKMTEYNAETRTAMVDFANEIKNSTIKQTEVITKAIRDQGKASNRKGWFRYSLQAVFAVFFMAWFTWLLKPQVFEYIVAALN